MNATTTANVTPANADNMIIVGNRYEWDTIADVRSPQQRDAVRAIMANPEFGFACGNPFTLDRDDDAFRPGKPPYQGPFWFIYYTRDRVIHFERIGKQGKTLRHLTGKCDTDGTCTVTTRFSNVAKPNADGNTYSVTKFGSTN